MPGTGGTAMDGFEWFSVVMGMAFPTCDFRDWHQVGETVEFYAELTMQKQVSKEMRLEAQSRERNHSQVERKFGGGGEGRRFRYRQSGSVELMRLHPHPTGVTGYTARVCVALRWTGVVNGAAGRTEARGRCRSGCSRWDWPTRTGWQVAKGVVPIGLLIGPISTVARDNIWGIYGYTVYKFQCRYHHNFVGLHVFKSVKPPGSTVGSPPLGSPPAPGNQVRGWPPPRRLQHPRPVGRRAPAPEHRSRWGNSISCLSIRQHVQMFLNGTVYIYIYTRLYIYTVFFSPVPHPRFV